MLAPARKISCPPKIRTRKGIPNWGGEANLDGLASRPRMFHAVQGHVVPCGGSGIPHRDRGGLAREDCYRSP